MIYKLNKFLVICIFILFSNPIFSQQIKEKVDEILKLDFGNGISIDFEKYFIPDSLKSNIENRVRQKFFSNSVYLYKIFKGKKLLGIALLDNVYGKSMPITFLVVFDSTKKIIDTEILKYREPYGGAVRNKSWIGQFIGKSDSSSIEIGKDISSISGATISVNSVTKGVKKLTILSNYIIESIR